MAAIYMDAPAPSASGAQTNPVDQKYWVLDRERTFKLHLTIIGGLVLANAFWVLFAKITGHDAVFGIRRLFLLDYEKTFPTFFSAMALLACAICAALIWRQEKSAKTSEASLWGFVALILGYMAVDEAVEVHELTIPIVAALWKNSPIQFGWVVPFGILAIVIAARLVPLWWRQPTDIRRDLFIAGVVYVGSAIGMEIVGGAYAKAVGTKGLDYDMIYQAIVMTEEAGEMIGVALLLRTLLGKLQQIGSGIALVGLTDR